MNGLIAVARREIRERHLMPAGAAVLGLLTLLVPLFPGAARLGVAAARLATAAFTAVLYGGTIALAGGVAMGRDFHQRRLAFDFARPLSAAAVWGGRVAGLWIVAAVSAVGILLPAGLVDVGSWWPAAGTSRSALVAVLAAAALLVALALGSVLGSLRGESAWTLADLAMLVLLALAFAGVFLPLAAAGAPQLLLRVCAAVALGTAAALLLSGFAQVAIGRLDAARATRARFIVLWGLLALVTLVTLGGVRWLLAPSPRDLTSVWASALAPRGDWIVLQGWARDRLDLKVTFFYDAASGRFVRAGRARAEGEALSGDGAVGAWVQASLPGRDPREVRICRLDMADVTPQRLSLAEKISDLRLSPRGTRLAVAQANSIAVLDAASGRLLTAAAIESAAGRVVRFVFADEDRLLLYRLGKAGDDEGFDPARPAWLAVEELDAAKRSMPQQIRIAGLSRPFAAGFDDRRRRLILWENGVGPALFDSATGARVAVLGPAAWERGSRAFLFDGRPVLSEATGGSGRLRLFRADGSPERVYELGPAGTVEIGGEPEAGTLLLGISHSAQAMWESADAVVLLDLGSGQLRRIARHAVPVAAQQRWRLASLEPGSVAARLLQVTDGLRVLDPKAGSVAAVPPPR